MEVRKIIQLIFTVLVLSQDVSLLILHTDDVVILQKDNTINLNCTYDKGSNEEIYSRNIIWQKQMGGKFEDLAIFSPPGGPPPFVAKEMQPLYSNRTKLIPPNISRSAVLIIEDPVCNDEGTYRCGINYFSDSSAKTSTRVSVVELESKAREPEEFVVFPNELQENQPLSLNCSADVGSPPGNIQIWKISMNSDTSVLIYTSNSTNYKTDNCTEIINVTTTYTMTKKDNEALFRCSSQNHLTLKPGPSKESSRISVTYGPSNTEIVASFSNSRVFTGDHVKLECISDGNPNPNYTWIFNFTDVVSDAKYTFSADKSGLSFTITNITDSGLYQCVASNYINGKLFKSSSNVTLIVREKNNGVDLLKPKKMCYENPCSSVQSCVIKNGRAFCSLNIWIVIAIVFIIITLILCTTSLSFILLRRTQRLNSFYNTDEMDMGGYLSPVGEANGSSYEALSQGTVHVYSTIQNGDLLGHDSSYEALGQGTVHVYSTMQNTN